MILEKKQIRQLISEGQLKEAAQAALDYAEQCRATETMNALTNVSGQVDENRSNFTIGLIPYEEFMRTNARLTSGVTSSLDQLPETPSVVQKIKLTDELVFKKRLFVLLVLSKAIVIIYFFYIWRTGGFRSSDQAMPTLTSIITPIIAYVSLMLSDFIRQSRDTSVSNRRYISGFLVNIVWFLFPLYMIVQIVLVTEKAYGDITFLQMVSWFAFTESVIGIYIGKIVEEFFKKEK